MINGGVNATRHGKKYHFTFESGRLRIVSNDSRIDHTISLIMIQRVPYNIPFGISYQKLVCPSGKKKHPSKEQTRAYRISCETENPRITNQNRRSMI